MAHKLSLALTGDHLVLELVAPDASGLGPVLRGLLQRTAPLDAPLAPTARVMLAGAMAAGLLAGQLDQALSGLQLPKGLSLKGMPLEVQLGLDHSRIGLMDLSAVPPAELRPEACDAYARAWAAQMLHLDASSSVIRWELLKRPARLLVSCVDRPVVDVLGGFCERSGLEFSSCRPALLFALDRERMARRHQPAADLTLAWTDENAAGGRSAVVQLLRFEGRQLARSWRGWVPATAGGNGTDAALEQAIARFDRIHPSAPGAAVGRLVWPFSTAIGASA